MMNGRSKFRAQYRCHFATALLAVLLLLATTLTMTANPPKTDACHTACEVQFNAAYQACIYYENRTLTWGECHNQAMDQYHACKTACPR